MKSLEEVAIDALNLISECANDPGPHEGCSEFDNSDPVELCEPSIRKMAEENGFTLEAVIKEIDKLEHEDMLLEWEQQSANDGPYGRIE